MAVPLYMEASGSQGFGDELCKVVAQAAGTEAGCICLPSGVMSMSRVRERAAGEATCRVAGSSGPTHSVQPGNLALLNELGQLAIPLFFACMPEMHAMSWGWIRDVGADGWCRT